MSQRPRKPLGSYFRNSSNAPAQPTPTPLRKPAGSYLRPAGSETPPLDVPVRPTFPYGSIILGLDTEDAVEFRMTWIGIVALAAQSDPDLHRKLMGFPTDLPDLRRLRPPGGNRRHEGVNASWHARRKRGELPETY